MSTFDSQINNELTFNDVLHGFKERARESKLASMKKEIYSEAYAATWGLSISAKRVDFPQKDGSLTWGIEYSIPLQFNKLSNIYKELIKRMSLAKGVDLDANEIQTKINRFSEERYYDGITGLELPKNIESIKIVDLSPQEALQKEDRNIPSHRSEYNEKYFALDIMNPSNKLVDKAMTKFSRKTTDFLPRRKALDNLFKDIFQIKDGISKKEFIETIRHSNANEILFIHAHGGDSNIIGEETTELKRDHGKQSPGNQVEIERVVDEYDKPGKYAAILLLSCYIGTEDKRLESKVRVFSVQGLSGRNRTFIGEFLPSKVSINQQD